MLHICTPRCVAEYGTLARRVALGLVKAKARKRRGAVH